MVSQWIFARRFLARSKHILRCFVRGVRGQMPSNSRRYGRQIEINCVSAGIEYQAKCALIIFLDQASELLFFRVGPVGQSPMRAKPMDLSIRIELFLAQNRMGATKGDHATSEVVDFLMPFEKGPVFPTDFVVLAVGVVVAALAYGEIRLRRATLARRARSAG